MSVLSIDTRQRHAAAITTQTIPGGRNISQALELSASRTYDRALETLGAYKLTGNFFVDLEIVLKDMRVLDKVAYDIEPKFPLSDRRHVEFRPKDHVHRDRFSEIMRRLKDEVGAEPSVSFWTRLFR
jgi:hypothetical protein